LEDIIDNLQKKFELEEIIQIFELFLERGHIFDNLTIYDIAEHASVDLILWLTNCIDDVNIKASSEKNFYNIDWALVFMGAIKGKNVPLYTWILDNKLSYFSYDLIVDTDYYKYTVSAIEKLLIRGEINQVNGDIIMDVLSDEHDLKNDNTIDVYNSWKAGCSINLEIEPWYAQYNNMVIAAIFNNYLRTAMWLINCGCKFSVNQCIYYATQLGRLPILVYLKEYTDNAAADNAAADNADADNEDADNEGDADNADADNEGDEDYDDTPHIKDCWLNPNLCNIAAYYGQLEVLEWLIQNGCYLDIQLCIEFATNECVSGSRYDILSYLLRLQKQLE
jgi:hypothetical protein